MTRFLPKSSCCHVIVRIAHQLCWSQRKMESWCYYQTIDSWIVKQSSFLVQVVHRRNLRFVRKDCFLFLDWSSQNFTVFNNHFGSYKWHRMSTGLTGSLNTFQSLIEHFLVDLTWKTTVSYRDDCIIFAASPEEPLERLRAVFHWVLEANLKENPSKCKYFETTVRFSGHVLGAKGLQVDQEKLAPVNNFPIFTCQTSVNLFLGIWSYYRRYVENFAEIARLLHKLTESNLSFNSTPEA